MVSNHKQQMGAEELCFSLS